VLNNVKRIVRDRCASNVGHSMAEYGFNSPIILAGCDDDNKPEADRLEGLRVKIETPEPYFYGPWSR